MTGFSAGFISPDSRGVAGWADDQLRILARATTVGVAAATEGLKTELRAMIADAGLGDRLPLAVRSQVYPRGRASANAAGLVWARGQGAQTILAAFSQGVTIRSARGFFLAIPLPAAGAAPRGQRMTPALWERRHGMALQFVYRRGAAALLVAKLRSSQGKRGGFRKASDKALASGRNLASVPVFVLLPQVTLTKRLEPDRVAQRWADQAPALIERALPRG
jgi:hypothetical protein